VTLQGHLKLKVDKMRKITQNAIKAFIEKKSFKSGNTEVRDNNIKTEFYLHGNLIAYKNKKGFYISSCGWETNTTRERLNGLLSELNSKSKVFIKNFRMYYEDNKTVLSLNDYSYIKVI